MEACNHDSLTETDKTIITEVTSAYEQTAVKVPIKEPVVSRKSSTLPNILIYTM